MVLVRYQKIIVSMVCEVNWIKELVLSNIVYTWKLFKMKFKIFWNRNNCNQFN